MKLVTVLALAAVAAFPTVARADDPCAEQAALESSLCRADRPFATISVVPPAPRSGGPVTLYGGAFGRGLTYAWDLDGDGEYDDAAGADVTTTLTGASARVGVRMTDDAGRSATETRSFPLHAFNTRPSGTITVTPGSARAGTPVTVKAVGSDADGRIAKTELDLDGDGTFERVAADAAATYATTGERTIRARFTDDAGGTAVVSTALDVHAQNLPPSVSLQRGEYSSPNGGPLIAGTATVTARVADPDGSVVGVDFDLDGDGAYETPAPVDARFPLGPGARASTAFTAGEHEVGVRVTDADGATATARESVLAVERWPIAGTTPRRSCSGSPAASCGPACRSR